MTSKMRKPLMNLSGIPPELAKILRPVKETLEMLTGAKAGMAELKGLEHRASNEQIVSKLNEVIRRLNASGGDHV